MADQHEKVKIFREMHTPGNPFIIPNPWDAGSAQIFEKLGYKALATTSSGFASTLGREDYGVTRDEVLIHCETITSVVEIPVSADLENGFGHTPENACETIRLAMQTGLVGGSMEDSTGNPAKPVFDEIHAVERIAAAVEAAKTADSDFVLTARAEEFLYGSTDLDGVIQRLQKFSAAGADVLFAPGLPDIDAVRTVCRSVDKPVNVLVLGELANETMENFAEAGVARVSLGGGLAKATYNAAANIAGDVLTRGTFENLR